MPRILLLLPTTSYRTKDFIAAAERLGAEVAVASERASVFAANNPEGLLALSFFEPERAAAEAVEYSKRFPVDAVIAVDEDTAVAAASTAEALGLAHNSVASARAARDKFVMRELLSRSRVQIPTYGLFHLDNDPSDVAHSLDFPVVVKPLFLSTSRGVIRANNPDEFAAALKRIESLLAQPDVAAKGGEAARKVLIERFVPGREVALEGLLTRGRLRVLAIFDKPDPLDGPFFEETIYVTPSRLPCDVQRAIEKTASDAAVALGLREGPVHAELRVNHEGVWLIEMAARSIGGLCSRTLRFGTGLSLEDLILRHALGMEVDSLERQSRPAGVMMIPIPKAGVLREIHGLDEARAVANVEEVTMTAHITQHLVPVPEGAAYLGFIFARAETPEQVEHALRQSHSWLRLVIE